MNMRCMLLTTACLAALGSASTASYASPTSYQGAVAAKPPASDQFARRGAGDGPGRDKGDDRDGRGRGRDEGPRHT